MISRFKVYFFLGVAILSLVSASPALAISRHIFGLRDFSDPRTFSLQGEGDNNNFDLSGARLESAPSTPDSNLVLKGNDELTLTGAPGETVVLNLNRFVLRDNAILTLQGSATTSFIINVSRKFSLSGNAQVIATGGLDVANIAFNAQGSGKVSLKGNARLEGILFALQRTVVLRDHSVLYGRVFAKKLKVKNAATIVEPPIVSP